MGTGRRLIGSTCAGLFASAATQSIQHATSDLQRKCERPGDNEVWDALLGRSLSRALKPGAVVVNSGTGDFQGSCPIAAHFNATFLEKLRVGAVPTTVTLPPER